jgi:5-methylcytosine-specific restriction endonuclease McrA
MSADLILDKDERPVSPEWGDGSLAAMMWASQQRCPSPLAKLILLRVCDCTGMSAEWGVWVGTLAEWCCAECDDVTEAIAALGDAGLLHVWINENFIHVTLPWWRDLNATPRGRVCRPTKADLRREMWDLQNGKCWYCGCDVTCDHLRVFDDQENLVDPEGFAPVEIEHQIPRSQGGGDAKDNLVLACKPCNRAKRDRTVDEYRAYLHARTGAPVRFHGERSA